MSAALERALPATMPNLWLPDLRVGEICHDTGEYRGRARSGASAGLTMRSKARQSSPDEIAKRACVLWLRQQDGGYREAEPPAVGQDDDRDRARAAPGRRRGRRRPAPAAAGGYRTPPAPRCCRARMRRCPSGPALRREAGVEHGGVGARERPDHDQAECRGLGREGCPQG